MNNDKFEFRFGSRQSIQPFYDYDRIMDYINKLEPNKTYGIMKFKGGVILSKDEVILKSKIQEIIKQLDIDIERNARRKLDAIKETGDSIECTLIAYDPEIVKYRLLKLMED